jgi:predicted peptidase
LLAPLAACLSTSAEAPSGPALPRNAMTLLQEHVFTDSETGITLPYRLFVPPACTPASPCGLLLFLHGAGERGNDNQAQLKNDALAFTSDTTQQDHPTIVVYPQCPRDMQWVDAPWADGSYDLAHTPPSQAMAAVLKLLDGLVAQYPVDAQRLLVTGLSMGGFGTWDLLLRHPSKFAGALVLCGGGDPGQVGAIRDVPVWAFHGDRDPAVPVRASRKMIQALRQAGASPRYTEVADRGHDVWTVAYRDLEVVRWLLTQRRGGER